MTQLETFRAETRAWLDENCPGEMRKHGEVAWGGRKADWSCDDQKLWMERMTDDEDIGLYLKRARVAELTLGDGGYHRDRFALLHGY